jgi:5'-3' exonuclease
MNGIIHHCRQVRSEDTVTNCVQGNKAEQQLILEVFEYVENLVYVVQPYKNLFMALDGVPPRAKMTQQRQRRFQHLSKKTPKEPKAGSNPLSADTTAG